MNDLELLKLIKKEAKCKTNQCLLETIERLGDIIRGKVRRAVYLTDTQYRLKQGVPIGRAEVPPEVEINKDAEEKRAY